MGTLEEELKRRAGFGGGTYVLTAMVWDEKTVGGSYRGAGLKGEAGSYRVPERSSPSAGIRDYRGASLESRDGYAGGRDSYGLPYGDGKGGGTGMSYSPDDSSDSTDKSLGISSGGSLDKSSEISSGEEQ